MTIQEYRDLDAVNYSLLSALSIHPSEAKRMLDGEKKESPEISFGSLLDCIMFTKDELNDRFYVSKFEKSSDKLGELIDKYIELYGNSVVDTPNVTFRNARLLTARKESNYQMNWKDETVIEKVSPIIDSYLQDIYDAKSRTIITNQQLNRAKYIKESLLTNQFTKDYFNGAYTCLYQEPIIWEENGIKYKTLQDIIVINEEEKIVGTIDLKSFSDNFKSSYYKYRYYYQGSLYTHGLSHHYPRFDVKSPLFLAADSNNYKKPVLYQMSQNHIAIAKHGGRFETGHYVKGWQQLAEELLWHKKNDIWDYTYEQYNNHGIEIIK